MGNELKLSLENFQSISYGDLIFHTGTNVIIGQSNSGKTATFRALKACLSNPSGSQRFIKRGTKSSSVMLEYNGNQIIWKRTPKESSYIINGETYLKTGSSNAFKIIEDTGFVRDYNDIIMNIEEELQLPFPFGISKTDLFKLYEDVFCISDSSIILKAAKSSEDETKSDIVTLENEINKNENKLKKLLKFKSEISIEKLKGYKEYLENKGRRIEFLKEGLLIIKKAVLVQDFKVEVKDYDNLLEPYKDKKRLQKELIRLKELHKVGKALKGINIPETVDLSNYKELRELYKTKELLNSISNIKVEVVSFDNKIQQYRDLTNLNRTLTITSKLENLSLPLVEFENKLQKYKELKDYLKSLKILRDEMKNKNEKLKSVQEFIENIEGALKEYKVCPLCHQPLK